MKWRGGELQALELIFLEHLFFEKKTTIFLADARFISFNDSSPQDFAI